MMKKNKKIKILFIIILLTNIINSMCWADDLVETNNEEEVKEIIQTAVDINEEPKINSRAGVIYDRKTGRILWGKNENEKRKMASTTKMMTAIVVIENVNLQEKVKVSKKAANTGGSRLGLTKDAEITVNDLLYGLMLCSGNDDAVT